MDGGLNIAVGLSGRGRLLNLLHGFYGVGTMIGPLLVTGAILVGSWRTAYAVLLVLDAVVAVLWLLSRATSPPAPTARPASAEPVRGVVGKDLRWSVVAGIAVFFVYTGLEVSAGQWETTFARGHLHFSAWAAGLATFGYWAALAGMRLALGALRSPPRHSIVVRAGTAAAVAAAAVIWWEPSSLAVVAGFVVLGGALAGVFPALVALTPARVGEAAASHVIAWQIGAATAGGAALSALVGLWIQNSGLTVLGPSLTVMALALVVGEIVLRRIGRTDVR
jgi:fucose permease